MIGLLLAAALVLPAAPPEPSARELGRSSVYAGFCAELGWETSRERVIAAGDAYAARHPEREETELAAEITLGIGDGQTEIGALIESFHATADVIALKQAIETRCDAVVRDVPEFLSRSAGTAASFDAAIAEIAANNVGGARP
ncbi:hypothetical protein [Brevundimonas sp.]|uniref:hypothetical protein n=1 Tax=Brevundimonas sp. TaxID=1871086 RepID=UPI002D729197|nr:hypothetical protein [Brevundimonas sp.]HYC75890.1 hypothetical protein [Brevundimonas sp.]